MFLTKQNRLKTVLILRHAEMLFIFIDVHSCHKYAYFRIDVCDDRNVPYNTD